MAKVKMKRTLKRGIEVRVAQYEDVRYFYAGYKEGCFDDMRGAKVPDDLGPKEFSEFMMALSSQVSEIYTAYRQDGDPLVMLLVTRKAHIMEVHAVWMPWATARNKLEVAVKFFNEMNKDYLLLTVSTEDNKELFFHVRKYGVMKFVGKIKDYFNIGEVGYQFQGVRKVTT